MRINKYRAKLFYDGFDPNSIFSMGTEIRDINGNYIVIIQKHWNDKFKCVFWGPVDDNLLMDILEHENFDTVFKKESVDKDAKKPNVLQVRKLMWKLGMKRPPKQPWE